MHEIRIGKHAVTMNNVQFCTLFFFTLSGMGFAACGFMVLLEVLRWGYFS